MASATEQPQLQHPAPFPAEAIKDAIQLAISPLKFKDDPGRYADDLLIIAHWGLHQFVGDPKGLALGAATNPGMAASSMHVLGVTDAQAANVMKSLLAQHERAGADEDSDGPTAADIHHSVAAGISAYPAGLVLLKWALTMLVNSLGV